MVRTLATGDAVVDDTTMNRQQAAEAARDAALSEAETLRASAAESDEQLAEAQKSIQELSEKEKAHKAALQAQQTLVATLQAQMTALVNQVAASTNSRRTAPAATTTAATDDRQDPLPPSGIDDQSDIKIAVRGVAAGRCYLRLNISVVSANHLIFREGLAGVDALKALTDDRIKRLCYATRRPGGSTGVTLPEFAEFRLGQLVYYVKKLLHCRRIVDLDCINTGNLDILTPQQELEKSYDPTLIQRPEFTNSGFSRGCTDKINLV